MACRVPRLPANFGTLSKLMQNRNFVSIRDPKPRPACTAVKAWRENAPVTGLIENGRMVDAQRGKRPELPLETS
jgi:hypothetical protein